MVSSQSQSPLWMAVPVIINNQPPLSMGSDNAVLSIWGLCISVITIAALAFVVSWVSPGGSAWATSLFKSQRKPIPGPGGMLILGNLMVMGGLAHRSLASLAQRYKTTKRLMGFSLGFTRVVICSQPELAKEILEQVQIC